MPYRPETVTATNSHAVMAAEIARLRKAIREALLQLEMCSRPLRVANAVDTLKGALR